MKKITFIIFLALSLFLFPKTQFAIEFSQSSFFNTSSKIPPANIETDNFCKHDRVKNENLSLEARIKAAQEVLREEDDFISENKLKKDILNIIEENQKILLRKKIDPVTEKYFSAEGYESLMILLDEFKDTSFLPFLINLTEKTKNFKKSSLVSSSEYITWALKSTTLENKEKLSSKELKEISSVLNSVYKYAEDNQISNWANSTLIEMAKSGIEEASIKKKEPGRVFVPIVSKTDKQKIKNLYKEISYNKIENVVKKLQSFRTRYPNTKGHEKAAQFIMDELKKAGLSVKTQEFRSYGSSFRNIISTVKGTGNSRGKIVICAHYDSIALDLIGKRAPAPGANDNASGVATLLEIARVLKSSEIRFNSTIEFVFFDAEEVGKEGSDYYVKKALLNGEDIKEVFNLDSIAWDKDKKLEIVSNNSSKGLLKLLKKISRKILPSQQIESSIREQGIGDEFNFWQGDHRGSYHAVLFTSDMSSPDPRMNSSADRWGHLQKEVLKDAAKFSLVAVAALADPLDPIELTIDKFVSQVEANRIKIIGKNLLKYRFDHNTLKSLLAAFNLIPRGHLKVLDKIKFKNLKIHAAVFDYEKNQITVNTNEDKLSAKAIVHETGHLVYHTLKDKMPEMEFKGDYNLLSKFYYVTGGVPPEEEINPEGKVDETFAVMYQMYLTEPKKLKKWIETKGTKLSRKNYEFLKNTVFREDKIKSLLKD